MAQYDSFAHDFSRTRHFHWEEFEMCAPFISPHARILDAGCGNGRLRSFLSEHRHQEGCYFGFDNSQEFLDIARSQYPHDHFFLQDMKEPLVFGSDTFDMIIGIASFHHLLSRHEQNQFLSECFRVLKPNGILFLTTWKIPKKHFWPNILRGRFKNWNVPFGTQKYPRTYRRVSDRELRNLTQKNGFQCLESHCVNNKNFVVLAQKQKH